MFVGLVHDGTLQIRKLWKDDSMSAMNIDLNVQIDIEGEQIHCMIYDPSIRENFHFLRNAFETVDQPLDINVRYLLVTDRYKDQLYIFVLKDIEGKVIEEIELSEEHK